MNRGLVDNWNSVVSPLDTVYCLGDFSLSGKSVEMYSNMLNGTKFLVPGNHDPVHPYNKHYKKSIKRNEPNYWLDFYRKYGWTVLPIIHYIDLPEVGRIVLSHIPYSNTDSRFEKYVPIDTGTWLICGHVHEKWKTKDRCINVGVDVWNMTPVSANSIIEIIKG